MGHHHHNKQLEHSRCCPGEVRSAIQGGLAALPIHQHHEVVTSTWPRAPHNWCTSQSTCEQHTENQAFPPVPAPPSHLPCCKSVSACGATRHTPLLTTAVPAPGKAATKHAASAEARAARCQCPEAAGRKERASRHRPKCEAARLLA